MNWTAIFQRKKTDDEAIRRERLLRHGRIADARIFDIGTSETGLIAHIFYSYNVGGVDYESSQPLNQEQRARAQDDYAPGISVTVRYDPRQPTNSIVV